MHNQSLEGHTVRRFDNELTRLHRQVFEMGRLVRNQLADSLQALKDHDCERARKIGKADRKVNSLESEVDEKVIEIAARRAPLGRDLRIVLVVSKCVTELEEAGDDVVSIAEKILQLCDVDGLPPNPEWIRELGNIAEYSADMLNGAMNAYEHLEEDQAQRVIDQHRALAEKYQTELRRLVSLHVHDSSLVSQVVDIALIARSLESIGQHAKKIAEHVIFFVRGEDVRHLPA